MLNINNRPLLSRSHMVQPDFNSRDGREKTGSEEEDNNGERD